jgi:hypothetical protein
MFGRRIIERGRGAVFPAGLAGLAALVAVAYLGLAAPPATAAGLFDRPIAVKRQAAGPGRVVTCTYYADFMLRVISEGQSPQEGMLISGERPPCNADEVAEATTLGTADYTFDGRKGPFLLFSTVDAQGATSFIVIHSAKGDTVRADTTLARPPYKSLVFKDDRLVIGFQRVVNAPCSLLQDAAGCWDQLDADGAIPASLASQPPPADLCAKAYQAARAANDDPSIIGYPTEVAITADGKVEETPQGPLTCKPVR